DRNNSGGDYDGYLLESSGYATNTGVVDDAEGGGMYGRFWVFDGPTVDHLMTSYNSGDQTSASWGNIIHSAGVRSTTLSFNGKNYQGSEDAGNAIYARHERTMPSWTMAHILRDAYGYSIIDPERFGTFYANLNRDTGVLNVRGGNSHYPAFPDTNDRIYISADGSTITVAVDPPADIPGTHASPGGGDFPAWTSTFSTAEVSSIVVEPSSGHDEIFIYGLPAGVSVTVNAASGNDYIQIGNGDIDDLNTGVQGNVVVNGGLGTDTLSYYDLTDNVGNDTYTLTSTSITKTMAGITFYNNAEIESISITANGFNNDFDVNSLAATPQYSLSGFGGNDTFTFDVDFDSNIEGSVSCLGGAGVDRVIVDDSADVLEDEYLFSGNRFEKVTFGDGAVAASSSTEEFLVTLNPSNNTINIPQVSSWLSVTVRGGNGNDSFTTGLNNLDANILGPLRVEGGVGTDSVVIDDSSDFGNDTYTLGNTLLTKPGVSITYTTFESFRLDCNLGNNDINVAATASSCPYTINGSAGNDQLFVNDGSSFLFNFGSDITFNGGSGTGDQVNINDSQFNGVETWAINNGHVALPFNSADVFFSATESLVVTGGNGGNTFNVNQTSIATNVIGGDAADTINIGSGNFTANITASVLVIGDAGSDLAIIQDTLNAASNLWTIDSADITHDGTTGSVLVNFFGPTIEAVRVDAGAGSSTFNINSLGSSTAPMNVTVQGGGGADTFNVADGNFSDMFGNVSINGQAGSDSLQVNDSADTGADSYTLTSSLLSKSDWAFSATYSLVENLQVEANGADNTITVNSTDAATAYRLNGNGGVDSFIVNDSNVAVVLDGGAGLDNISVNSDAVGTALARLVNNQDLQNLNIRSGGLLTLDPGKKLIDTVSASIGGRLDLTDGGFIDRAFANEPTYRTLLTSGYQGGSWNGPQPAIFSSSAAGGAANDALGYGTGGQTGLVSFFGVTVTAGDLMIRYSLNGDSNLDGGVNINDFSLLASNFNAASTNWPRGNYNYDANTDIADFAQLAANFNTTVPGDQPRPRPSVFSSVLVSTANRRRFMTPVERDSILTGI
ncbi:MAG: hypothetical protein NZ561_00545, partial [Phycisphaerae bacterium]|nr:hypothetical protein [Phycisphaerae bacterium]